MSSSNVHYFTRRAKSYSDSDLSCHSLSTNIGSDTCHNVYDTPNFAQPPQNWIQGIWPPDAIHGWVNLNHEASLSSSLTMQIGDTKAGVLVGKDRYGNKYFENLEEDLPLRTRWVDYKDKELDATQIDPGWHAWMSYMVDKPPSEDPLMAFGKRPWESPETKVNMTLSRGAYKPYSTYVTVAVRVERLLTYLQGEAKDKCLGPSGQTKRWQHTIQ